MRDLHKTKLLNPAGDPCTLSSLPTSISEQAEKSRSHYSIKPNETMSVSSATFSRVTVGKPAVYCYQIAGPPRKSGTGEGLGSRVQGLGVQGL